MSTLFVPMAWPPPASCCAAPAFVFRKTIQALTGRRLLGATFALSSVVTPFFLGAALRRRRVGRVRVGDPGRRSGLAWIGPTSILIGALAVLCAAFLAAVFLVFDARRALDDALERYFRRRAIGSAAATGLLAIAGLFVLRSDAPFVFHGLLREGLPFVFFSAACGIAAHRPARTAGSRAAPGPWPPARWWLVLAGWGVAQYPYLLPTSLTIAAGAGAPANAGAGSWSCS